jgi:hypothetical protein
MSLGSNKIETLMTTTTVTSSSNRFVLGMNLDDLSLKDIREELTDIKRDLGAIEDYESGLISGSVLMHETMFKPSDKQKLIDAEKKLREEIRRRNDNQ